MHEVRVNRLGGLSLPRKSVAMITVRTDMTSAVYRGRKTTQQQQIYVCFMNIKYNMELLDAFQFSQTKYKNCNDEETLKGKYCFETPFLGKDN